MKKLEIITLSLVILLSCSTDNVSSVNKVEKKNFTKKEVVKRVMYKFSHSRMNELILLALTDSGKIVEFNDNEVGYFIEPGDTIVFPQKTIIFKK